MPLLALNTLLKFHFRSQTNLHRQKQSFADVQNRCSLKFCKFHRKTTVLKTLFETPTEVFSCEICKNFKNTFFYRTSPVAASASCGLVNPFRTSSLFLYPLKLSKNQRPRFYSTISRLQSTCTLRSQESFLIFHEMFSLLFLFYFKILFSDIYCILHVGYTYMYL